MADRDDANAELAERVAALERAVERIEEREREVPRGPLGLPRPPTPREALTFATEDAIPTAVAVLDAQVRALEALRSALRLLEPGVRAAEGRDGGRDADARRETLARLDAAIDDLRSAASGDALPSNRSARDLLTEARELTADLEAEVEAAREERDAREATEREAAERERREEREERARRVEDELDVLREEYDEDGGDASDEDGGGGGRA